MIKTTGGDGLEIGFTEGAIETIVKKIIEEIPHVRLSGSFLMVEHRVSVIRCKNSEDQGLYLKVVLDIASSHNIVELGKMVAKTIRSNLFGMTDLNVNMIYVVFNDIYAEE